MRNYSVLVLVGAFAVAGCISARPAANTATPSPGHLEVLAHWGPWEGTQTPHLLLTLRHVSGGAVLVGRDGANVSVTGPNGRVPVDRSSQSGAREIGETVDVALHPTLLPDGSTDLSIDHASGPHVSLPVGAYTVCVRDDCTVAKLT